MKLKLEVVARNIVEIRVPENVDEEELVELLDSCPIDLDELPSWCYVDTDDFMVDANVEVEDGEIED